MLLVLPICNKDYESGYDLVEWIRELGTYPKHMALVLASKDMDKSKVTPIVHVLKEAKFSNVTAVRCREEDPRGWFHAPNLMFRTAAEYVERQTPCPWFWCEPDCIPLKAGWIDTLQSEYVRAGKPFCGAVWGNGTNPPKHLTGCAVYPSQVRAYNPAMLTEANRPFDCIRPEVTLKYTHETRLINHLWGDIAKNIAPTFPDRESLSQINPGAVVWHRCKDRRFHVVCV